MTRRRAAFSLVETVIAVGIFACAIATMLALLPVLTRQSAEATDALVARHLTGPLRVELAGLAAHGGFDGLAMAIPVMGVPLENGLLFVADRDGARLQSAGYLPPAAAARIPPEEQFFAVEVWRFDQSPLAYEPNGAVLPLYVRISGPYRMPGNDHPTPLADRSQFAFAVALNR